VSRKIRWGVLGVAKIATEKVIPAMQKCQDAEVAAIASRTLEKAQAAARRLGLGKVYGSYEELLADPDIDAIYNPLPNHLHVPWSIKALEAGKHVLCEKPIGLSAADGQTLVEAGRRHPRLKLMEAFMYRHHPQWITARRLVAEGRIGPLCTVQTLFSYFNDNPRDVRNQAAIGGGGLLDIGCYAVSLSRFLFDREPQRVLGIVEFDPQFGTDRLASGMLDFGSGTGTFTCGTPISLAGSGCRQAAASKRSRCRCVTSTRSRAISSRGPSWKTPPCRRPSKTP
jgi:predicted dehydrogenase